MMSPMQLVFIYGPAASGKYTVAKAFSESSGMRFFHNHLVVDLVAALFDFGSEAFVRMRESIWLDAFAEAAEQSQSLVFTFQPEATVRPGFPECVLSTVMERGGEVVFVELVCPEAELERRIEGESRAAFGKLRSLEDYRRLRDAGAFDFPPMPEPALRIDTSKCSPDVSAQRIEVLLKSRE